MNTTHDSPETTRRVVEELYRCGLAGDVAGLMALVDPSVVVYEPPFLPYGGKYEGLEGFGRLVNLVQEKYFDDSKMEVQYIAVDGPHAVVINHIPGYHGETVILAEEVLVRAGKVVEMRIYVHQSPEAELNGFAR